MIILKSVNEKGGGGMKSIHIDFISQEDIRISIDGEILEDIAGFRLKIKEGKTPKYSVTKKAIENKETKKDKDIDIFSQDLMNINKAAQALNMPYSIIKRFVDEGKISYIENGNQRIVDLNEIKRYFANTMKKNKNKRNLVPIK